jgi:protein-S-isoprenylcysteine O-methyltransferase Ste14
MQPSWLALTFQFILRLFGVLWYGMLFGIILPVSMVLVSLALDQWLFELAAIQLFASGLTFAASVLFILCSIVLLSLSVMTLHREGKGWPWSLGSHAAFNPQKLVTTGPYALVRHPMTLAYLLYLLALGCLIPSVVMLFWLIPLTAGMFYEYLEYTEELRLKRWFGETYLRYHRQTPSLFPRFQALFLDIIHR